MFYTVFEDAVRKLKRKEAAPLRRQPFMPASRLFEKEASRIFATVSLTSKVSVGRDISGTQKSEYRTDLYLQLGRDVYELPRFGVQRDQDLQEVIKHWMVK